MKTPDERPRILVLGTGAMGCLFAASLARHGDCEVTVSGSWRDGRRAIRTDGIVVEEDGAEWRALADARPVEDPGSSYDLVLVLTTSRRTSSVAETAAVSVAEDGLILTLQNGLGNREILAAAAGDGRVAAGVTAIGATLLGPGRVRVGGRGPTVLGGLGERLERAREILAAAGFDVDITADLQAALWTKLAVNCAINPLSAIARLPNGHLADLDAWRLELEAAAREVGEVAAAKGITIGLDLARHAVGVARDTAANRSSMLQDLDAGHPTEIDALCGAVVAEGRRARVPVPRNERLARWVRERELIGT